MPNQHRMNHRDEHVAAPIEHGYQDPRDQRDRENGRDDFRGLDSDRDNRFGDRYSGHRRGWSQGDQYAERDRDMYSDRSERNTGYGYNDGSMGNNMDYRGQSGAQSGNSNQAWRGQGIQGGSEGHWGDMDRGGRSGGDGSRERGQHAGKGPQGFQRSDERIKELVHEALTDHEHLDATHLIVDVKSGEVTLTGTVEDRPAKRLAEDVVERVTGVKDVLNQIRVNSASDDRSLPSNGDKNKLRH
jgi:BON domain